MPYPNDGVISGGEVSAVPGNLEIHVNGVTCRLADAEGFMTGNYLIVSAGDPTCDRIDVVYAFSPAPWILEPTSHPSPPGYDTVQVEGRPSADPQLAGSFYGGGDDAPFVDVGVDSHGPFAALYSYRVPAGATDSSEFTDFTDLRHIVT